ncbi:MAG: transglycosylase SLT domain-containing protein [Candidatus Pacearchaeota archaeon]
MKCNYDKERERKNTENKILIYLFVLLFVFLNIDLIKAYSLSNPNQVEFSQPDLINYYSKIGFDYKEVWPYYGDTEKCEATQDFIVNVVPGSCMPSVVRSDLLEEQNVPVFCKIVATKINPLIKTDKIKSVRIKVNNQSNIIAGASYFPSKSSIGATTNTITNPIFTDLGYVVINLKKQKSEKDMPNEVNASLTAIIEYDVENALGIGKDNTYYLPLLENEEWNSEYTNYGFWKGKGYLRLEDINENKAMVSIYSDKSNVYKKITLDKGKESSIIYIPGFYCKAGLIIKYIDQELPKERALIEYDGIETWVYENEKVGECTINKIDRNLNQIELRCAGKNYFLSIGFSNYVKINNEEKKIGQNLKEKDFLLYYGIKKENNQQKEFIVIAKNVSDINIKDGKIKTEKLESIKKGINSKTKLEWEKFKEAIKKDTATELGIQQNNILIIEKSKTEESYTFNEPVIIEKADYEENTNNINDYFSKAKDYVDIIVKDYGKEKIDAGEYAGEYYGALALYELAETAKIIGKQKTQIELLNKLIDQYSDSKLVNKVQDEIAKSSLLDFSSSSLFFEHQGETHLITLKNIKYPNKEEVSAKFDIYDNEGRIKKSYTDIGLVGLGEIIYQDENISIILGSIEKESAKISYKYKTKENEWIEKEIKVNLNEQNPKLIQEGNIKIKLVDINANYLAKIKLIPKTNFGRTETNFAVSIGIEKRAIKLTPEKTKERIENINKTLEQVEKISNNLNNVVKTWTKTCIATATILNIKNMFANIGGKATARTYVMTSKGGWNERCAELVVKGEHKSLDECFYKNKDKINKDVEKVTEIINEINQKIESAQSSGNTQKEIAKNLTQYFYQEIKNDNNLNQTFNSINTINDLIEKGYLTVYDMREIIFYSKTKNASIPLEENKINSLVEQIKKLKENDERENSISKEFENVGYKGAIPIFLSDNARKINAKIIEKNESKYVTIVKNNCLYAVPVRLLGEGSSEYIINSNEFNNGELSSINTSCEKLKYNDIKDIIFVSSGECKNTYQIINKKIAVYDTEPFKGMPKLVPFDLKQGWYIATKPSLSFLGATSSKPYSSSGMLSTFYLCNVGSNGKEEFESGGDDICTRIDMNSNQPLDQLPCALSQNEAKQLIIKGINTVEKVSKAYLNGEKGIIIDGNYFVFERAVNIPNGNCYDYMSVEDCAILFNVCDPVMCPASRCNLGGTWPTQNVIQEGIIGSLVLCLPNFGSPSEGKVLVPVCLTGVNAGLQAYSSLLKAHRDCLQENLNTGRMVGMCDEIYSIYLCDLTWRQLVPLLRYGFPKFLGLLAGKSTSYGGGEYLTINDAWKNMENSFNYFTNYYGINVMQAFKERTTKNIQTEICKSFISANYPSVSDVFDKLAEPPSPVQFYATLDQIPYTDVTTTETTHYKVYYHIYAGKDSGVYYSIYLKATSASTQFFNLKETMLVTTGYVKQGEYASETKDFLGPAGYDELCVKINNQEKCGFKQVTTDFTINYLKDKYVEQQVKNKEINSEEECVYGTSSYYSLANLNLQEGISSYTNPDISNIGIIRVCSTGEPSKDIYSSASKEGRWIAVGWCDKSKNIKCWLDTESVKNAIQNIELRNQTIKTLQEYEKEVFEKLKQQEGIVFNEEQNYKELKEKDKSKEPSNDYLQKLKEFLQKSSLDNRKAELLYNTYKIYENLVKEEYKKYTLRKIVSVIAEDIKEGKSQNGQTSLDNNQLSYEDEKNNGEKIKILKSRKETGLYFNYPAGDLYLDRKFLGTDFFVEDVQIGYFDIIGNLNLIKDYEKELKNLDLIKKDLESVYNLYIQEKCFLEEEPLYYPLEPDYNYITNNVIVGYAISSTTQNKEKKFCLKCSEGCKSNYELNSVYKKRYEEYKEYFNKYAKKNLPEGFDEESFKALLAAIVSAESKMGYQLDLEKSNKNKAIYIKNDTHFAGYKNTINKGPDSQLSLLSSELKSAFEGKNSYYLYNQCSNLKDEYQKAFCIIYIFKYKLSQGEIKDKNLLYFYSLRIIDYSGIYRDYFCSNKKKTSSSEEENEISNEEKERIKKIIENVKNYGIDGDNKKCKCVDYCEDISENILKYSKENGIDPLLTLAVIIQESECKKDVSIGSSYGLMQISFNKWKDKFNLKSKEELKDTEINIKIGTAILKEMYDAYKNGKQFSNACSEEYRSKIYYGWQAALRGYNGWKCNPKYPEQDKYVEQVWSRYEKLKEIEKELS